MSTGPVPQTEREPVGVDPNRASIARVYDAFLGGKDNYEIDRKVRNGVLTEAPYAEHLAIENRDFLIRSVRFIAQQTGITQFLDCGSGLPTAENTHQVVQRVRPDAEVVYVDNDPVVLAHGRALLEENDQTSLMGSDIFDPDDVLDNEIVRARLDLTQPIALLQIGTLHHYEGPAEAPAELMQRYYDRLASGSYVAISHFLDPENEHTPMARRAEDKFRHSPMGSGTFRTLDEIRALFGDLELVEPGVIRLADWWQDGPRLAPLNEAQHCIAGGVARKP
ncbi:SAM-dependent methyltransferase [Prauserella halophila]|uniref:SAM-dependent methyltransferase n=1 Tax=Prauserella halophila TaxID=185641 RepID=A0ABP4GY66_9PSEU|nr:SAM-dependent methyltransferase [Prauserella halophila]MCP2236933.1 S-adenosyl methyltransferase [Prauserella halophila]